MYHFRVAFFSKRVKKTLFYVYFYLDRWIFDRLDFSNILGNSTNFIFPPSMLQIVQCFHPPPLHNPQKKICHVICGRPLLRFALKLINH